ncbi:MAG: BphX family protein [Chloroflexota bacterium]
MNRLKWWFRIVGGFYTLLGVINLYAVLSGDPSWFRSTIPFPVDATSLQAFVDGWSPFAFEIFGIGVFLLWASRNPLKYLGVVYFAAWLEIMHGVLDDLYLIAHGYDLAGYVAFIVVHLIIAGTGVMFARQASAQSSQPASLAAKGNA